ncbi:hypothetical protein Angca_001463, partial [Angiostrongylus cantonensis]
MHCMPSTSLGLPEEPLMDPCWMRCQECGEAKNTTKQLFDHLFDYHNYDKSRIENIKAQRRTRSTHMKALRNSKALFICEVCGVPFLSRPGLMSHNEREHGLLLTTDVRIPCPQLNCTSRFLTYMELAIHADIEHRHEVTWL